MTAFEGHTALVGQARLVAVLHNGYMTNQVVSLDGGMHPR